MGPPGSKEQVHFQPGEGREGRSAEAEDRTRRAHLTRLGEGQVESVPETGAIFLPFPPQTSPILQGLGY